MNYDEINVFRQILDGKIAGDIVLTNESAVAINDIMPKAKIHILVIPRGRFVDFFDFHANASSIEKQNFYDLITEVLSMRGLDQAGFKLITRSGSDGGQEVPHFHVHILGGEFVGNLS
ncbi:MAG: HIT domain-containing protein [Holosporales bacterium]|jgi:histidine triad (HIT) family protein|nr:HIT domain-containing protein [Holosporales bacterium]